MFPQARQAPFPMSRCLPDMRLRLVLCLLPVVTSLQASPPDPLQAHRDALGALRARPDDVERLCLALDTATRASRALEARVAASVDRAMAAQARDPGALERLQRRLDREAAALPGVGLTLGSEGLYVRVRHDDLARLLPAGTPARTALSGLDGLLPAPRGEPVFLEPVSDVESCLRPAAARVPLTRMAQSWDALPACLRTRLQTRVDDAMKRLAGGCGCEGVKVAAELATLRGPLRTMGARATPRMAGCD